MKVGLWTQLFGSAARQQQQTEENFRKLDVSNVVQDYFEGELSINSLKFPTTAVPSVDPNTLDDYEEGLWTPTVGGNATYTTQTGTYTKIGRLVNLQFRLTINTLGTGSASTITGMPFNASVLSAGTVGFWASLSGTYVYVTCFIQVNSIFFIGATAATAGLTAPANILQNGADVLVNVTYPT